MEKLQECHRILRPSGKLVVITPNATAGGHRLFKDAWRHLDPPRYLQIFSSMSLQGLVQTAGFEKCSVFTSIRNANGVFLVSRSIRRKGYDDFGSRRTYAALAWARAMQLLEWLLLFFLLNLERKSSLWPGNRVSSVSQQLSAGDFDRLGTVGMALWGKSIRPQRKKWLLQPNLLEFGSVTYEKG